MYHRHTSESGYDDTVGIDSIVYDISNATLESISSLPVGVCFCNNQGQPDCRHQPPAIHVKKGEAFTLLLIALDQADNPVEANITTLLSPPDGRFSEGQQTQTVQQHCTQLSFNLFSPSNFEILTPIAVDSPCRNFRLLKMSDILINFLNCTCPVGFELSGDDVRCECVCDSALSPYITRCNSTTSSLLRKGTNSWINYVNDTDPYLYVIYLAWCSLYISPFSLAVVHSSCLVFPILFSFFFGSGAFELHTGRFLDGLGTPDSITLSPPTMPHTASSIAIGLVCYCL